MLKSYLKIAWRNLLKSPWFFSVNVLGLGIGIACCIMVLLFVLHHNSFDDFQPEGLYRVGIQQQETKNGAPAISAKSFYPLGSTLKAQLPELSAYAQVMNATRVPLQSLKGKVSMGDFYGVSSTFLSFFNFRMIEGNPVSANIGGAKNRADGIVRV